jgi:hypothetical protein
MASALLLHPDALVLCAHWFERECVPRRRDLHRMTWMTTMMTMIITTMMGLLHLLLRLLLLWLCLLLLPLPLLLLHVHLRRPRPPSPVARARPPAPTPTSHSLSQHAHSSIRRFATPSVCSSLRLQVPPLRLQQAAVDAIGAVLR